MARKICVFTLVMLAILACARAQAQSAPAVAASTASRADNQAGPADSGSGFQQRNPRYTLRPGDTFDLEFTFSPEFNQTISVGPDGFATFRGAGTIHVAGQTIPQLTDAIKTAYTGILRDPVISVFLKDFEKPYFIAGGQVGKPGKYDLRSDLSLVEAVNIAGGFTDASKHSQVVLFRRMPDDMVEARIFDVKKMLASRNLQEDPRLMPGDMVYVPQNFISKIQRYLPTSNLGMYANPMIP